MNHPQPQIKTTETVNDLLLIQWSDGKESVIPLTNLRDSCPCADCAGEKDIFGNVYKGPPKTKIEDSYILVRLETVGYYGLRPVWKDGHNTGIFTSQRLLQLGENGSI